GVSIIISNSMEPSLRRMDMVVYINTNYTVGDVVVYCITPSHCITHRVIEFIDLVTVNGHSRVVVTKGDNVDQPDSPVNIDRVRGKVVLTIWREIWIPLIALFLGYALRELVKLPVIGYSLIILYVVSLVSVSAVYSTIPGLIAPGVVKPPMIRLAGVYFQQDTCSISIRYINNLDAKLSFTSVEVNSTRVDVYTYNHVELMIKPTMSLLREAFEQHKPLVVNIEAQIIDIGELKGEYTLLIGGKDPEFNSIDSGLLVVNPNCFPIGLNISFKHRLENKWSWLNNTYVIDGFSQLVIESPFDSAYVYACWVNQGVTKCIGIPLAGRQQSG
ncbi:MAG: S26 family signal peptidase, partial [Desulfurococcaceae archaeon]